MDKHYRSVLLGLGAVILLSLPALAQTEEAPVITNEPMIPVVDENNDKQAAKNANETSGNQAASATDKPDEKPASSPVNISEIKSILFSDIDAKTIRSARAFYEQNVTGNGKGEFSEDDFLKKLENVTTVKLESSSTSFTYPQFFLSSLMYYSKNDWVIWVNDEKITQDSGVSQSGLKVTYIDGEKVGFDWKPARMDKIVDNGEYSADNPVKVDVNNNMVDFFLKPNQTFTSYAMQVVEGKVQPVTIDLKNDSIVKLPK